MGTISSVQVETHDRFESGWHLFQTIFWVVIALGVVLALFGYLGSGAMAAAKPVNIPGTPIQISYDHIVRDRAPSMMTLDVQAPIDSDTLAVRFDDTFLKTMDISAVIPQQMKTVATADGVEYQFALGPTRRGKIALRVQPKVWGSQHSSMYYGENKLTLNQLILP